MTLHEQLKAKQTELVALKSAIEAGDTAAITKAGEIADAITELEASIAAANRANEILKAMGTPASEEVAEDLSKDNAKSIAAKVKGYNGKRGWSVNATIKAATDPITSVNIAQVDRNVEPSTARVNRLADYFPQTPVEAEYNSVTYLKENTVEGSADNVAEGGKKPQISTGVTPVTAPLLKVAVYTKETEEAQQQAGILESTINETVERSLLRQENTDVINAITSGITATDVEYTEDASDTNANTQALMESILKAKAQIEDETDYIADLILMNPNDWFNVCIAKDANGQYFGGGWASGAYGNGTYNSTITPWGMSIFTSSGVTAGDAYVVATDAGRVYRKGDIRIRVFDQNEDDPIYNLITIRAEEQLLPVLRNGKAAVKVTPAE